MPTYFCIRTGHIAALSGEQSKRSVKLRNLLFIYLSVISTIIFSCGRSTDQGELVNEVYLHKAFGLELKIPNGWKAIYGKPGIQENQDGNNKLLEQNPWLKNIINENNLHKIEYLILKKETGSQFSIFCENLRGKSIVSSYGYLEALKSQLRNIKIGPHKQKITLQPNSTMINGKKFESLVWMIHFPNVTVHQKYMVRVVKKQAMIFHLVSRKQISNEAFAPVISRIKWKDF